MRWRILALHFFARIALRLQFQTLASVDEGLIVASGLSHAKIGALIGLFMAPGLFLAVPAGLSGRWFSDRTLTVAGLSALAAGGLLSSVATDSWTIGAGRVLAGAGFLFSRLYFTKMVTDWLFGREIATAMSILVMSWPFGIAMGQVGHEWLSEVVDWRAPFYAASRLLWLSRARCAVALPPAGGAASHSTSTGFALSKRELGLTVIAVTA
jgi:predicted MFS family arabinose efflux permease